MNNAPSRYDLNNTTTSDSISTPLAIKKAEEHTNPLKIRHFGAFRCTPTSDLSSGIRVFAPATVTAQHLAPSVKRQILLLHSQQHSFFSCFHYLGNQLRHPPELHSFASSTGFDPQRGGDIGFSSEPIRAICCAARPRNKARSFHTK